MLESDSWQIRVGQLHEFSVIAMFGVIWIIQLSHYPAFRWVDPKLFPDFHKMHSESLTWIAGPLMLIQLFSAYFHPERPWTYLALSLLVFALTFAVSVPIHNTLIAVKDDVQIEKLIRTNWWRTGVWTGHAFLILWDRIRA